MSDQDSTPQHQRSSKPEKTQYPGIYKLEGPRGTRYHVRYRVDGQPKKATAKTLKEARQIQADQATDQDRGEYQEKSKERFRHYLSEWIERYAGNGKRGFRENTRREYRRLLDNYAHRYFGERLRLCDVSKHRLAGYVDWLAQQPASRSDGQTLSSRSIKNAFVPVAAALADAEQRGLIRQNPATGLRFPKQDQIVEDDEESARVFSREQLRALLDMTPAPYRVLFETLASTGLRISEAIGLQIRDLHLDGSSPYLQVRRAIVRGRAEAPKTRHGRRSVPLPAPLVAKLREHLAGLPDQSAEALVFPSAKGTALDPDNLRKRTFKPLAEEVGAEWAGFHALRHTYASLQIAAGVNVLQLSRVLGHHNGAFTLSVYAHLLPGDQAPALDLSSEIRTQTGNDPDRFEPIPDDLLSEKVAA